MAEALEKIASIAGDRLLGATAVRVEAPLEGSGIQLDLGVHPDPDRIALDIEEVGRADADRDECLSDQPERLAHRTGRVCLGLRPQIGGDRLARSWSADEHQEAEESLRVSSGQTYLAIRLSPDVEPPQQLDAKVDALVGCHGEPQPPRAATAGTPSRPSRPPRDADGRPQTMHLLSGR